jgi:hypothetical protein
MCGRIWAILFITLLLAGCNSLTITYNYADWIALWRINHYFDISSGQKQFLEIRLETLHQWHRDHELPQYVGFLREISLAWKDGFSAEELAKITTSYEKLHNNVIRRLALDGAPFLSTVNRNQVNYLQEIIQEENQELLDEIGDTAETRLTRRREKIIDWLEEWLGPLKSNQRSTIAELIKNLPDTTNSWLNNRFFRQSQLVTLLSTNHPPMFIEDQIRNWYGAPPQDTFPGYIQESNMMRQAFTEFILEVDHLITEEQRHHGLERLDNLIHAIQSLTDN